MKGLIIFLSFCILPIIQVSPVQAHGVRVFAWSEGENIKVEAAFRGGRPARQAEVSVREVGGDAELVHGLTDDEGIFQFPVPGRARRQMFDLRIVADCGPGHRGEWLLQASDYLETVDGPVSSTEVVEERKTEVVDENFEGQSSDLNEELLRRLIAEELDRKLAPVKRLLHENPRSGTRLQDVIGGIGWLLGLAGIAAWFNSKKKE